MDTLGTTLHVLISYIVKHFDFREEIFIVASWGLFTLEKTGG